jgi:ArsR family transcriptional regulator, lead/cadmium/zinc/bismuth-responsive transcriptional repressor
VAEPNACDLLCLDLQHAERIREGLPDVRGAERAAAGARALADPTRLRIATALLAGDELCVCDVGWVVGQGQGLVSHHLRQLKVAELVESRRDGRLVMYRLTGRGRVLVGAVLGPAVGAEPAPVADAPEGVAHG